MKFFLAISLLLLISQVSAQVSIVGKLVDPVSGKTLSRATISIYDARDTSLISCRLSTFEGDFSIAAIPLQVPCRMIVYDSGYSVYRKDFTLTETNTLDMDSIILAPSTKPLEDMLVAAERPPIIVHKKTIEFSAACYKYLISKSKEGLVEGWPGGLIQGLPGIQISPEGDMRVNGEKIKRIFIDGMELINSLQ